jgi:hypothetical protein
VSLGSDERLLTAISQADRLLAAGDGNGAGRAYERISRSRSRQSRTTMQDYVFDALVFNRLGICYGLAGNADQSAAAFALTDRAIDEMFEGASHPARTYLSRMRSQFASERGLIGAGDSDPKGFYEVAVCEHNCVIAWPPPCGLEPGHCA